ncbi:thiamine pyrophosphokinase 1-like isoform X2 [Zingiber officinale]|uniref:thiamine pyrophosphokinase 1-like isoform X2 n=1 Tax=Zingiber officinale TaxID=94328 RepID=UPI001C4C11B4|nr:thiamine pyrophosphokinase 1-like isoform X2 [Zingiber officinale]
MEAMRHASTFLRFPAPPDISSPSYALVVLNQRLPRFAPVLWSHAKLRVFADGGANRVYDGMPNLFPEIDPTEVRHRYKPDIIRGDMDSIRKEVKEFYVNLGVKVEDVSHDQATTDLHKCVNYVCDSVDELDKSNVSISRPIVSIPRSISSTDHGSVL